MKEADRYPAAGASGKNVALMIAFGPELRALIYSGLKEELEAPALRFVKAVYNATPPGAPRMERALLARLAEEVHQRGRTLVVHVGTPAEALEALLRYWPPEPAPTLPSPLPRPPLVPKSGLP